MWNGLTFADAGTQTKTGLVNSKGCDSSATLVLSVNATTSSTTELAICPASLPYVWNGLTFADAGTQTKTGLVNSKGCDSSATLILSVNSTSISTTYVTICSTQLPYNWNGLTFNTAGIQTKTGFVNSNGCDSSATLILTVNATTSSSTSLTICSNQLPYVWNGLTFTNAGTQTKTGLVNNKGCDSSATLVLSVNPTTSSNTSLTICSTQLPYVWNGLTFTNAGTQTKTGLVNNKGCDSSATLVLSVNPTTSSNTSLTICSTQLPYVWNGLTFNAAGTQTKTGLVNSKGCDSSATLVLSVNVTIITHSPVAICPSDLPFTWNGSNYTNAGSYSDTLTSAGGCDSIAILDLVIKSTSSSVSTENVCFSQLPFSWNGNSYPNGGTYNVHFTNAVGCDSIATLNLVIGNGITPGVIISTVSDTVCSSDAVTFTANGINAGSAPVYLWKKNGTTISTGTTITFAPNTLFTGDIISCVLTANNPCQTTATAYSNIINLIVNRSPENAIIASEYGLNTTTFTTCVPGKSVTLYPTPAVGVWASSNPAVATVANASGTSTATVNTIANGTSTITFTRTTPGTTCTAVSSVIVNVAQQAIPNAITGVSNICLGSSSTYTTTSVGGVFSASGRININPNTGFATSVNAGNTSIRYTITNASGCSAFTSLNVTVNPLPPTPTIAYASGTTNVTGSGGICKNRTFTLVGKPAGGIWSNTGTAFGFTIHPATGAVSTGNVTGTINVNYAVTDVNGCRNSRTIASNIITCATKGITANTAQSTVDDIIVYPNPAKSFINLHIKTLVGTGSIVITDLFGKQIKQQNLSIGTNTINVSGFAKGMYLVSVITEESKKVTKVVIE